MRPVQPGEKMRPHMTAEWFNKTLPKTEVDQKGNDIPPLNRLVICRTTSAIAGAEINESDTEDTTYYSGLVNTYVLDYSSNGIYSPHLTNTQRIMINPSQEEIPSGTEVWAMEAEGGIYIATIWVC